MCESEVFVYTWVYLSYNVLLIIWKSFCNLHYLFMSYSKCWNCIYCLLPCFTNKDPTMAKTNKSTRVKLCKILNNINDWKKKSQSWFNLPFTVKNVSEEQKIVNIIVFTIAKILKQNVLVLMWCGLTLRSSWTVSNSTGYCLTTSQQVTALSCTINL